jgi:hypothetical protein
MISVTHRTFELLHELCRYAATTLIESAERTSDPRLRRELHRLGYQHADFAHDLVTVLAAWVPLEQRTNERRSVQRRRARSELALAVRVQRMLLDGYEQALAADLPDEVLPLVESQYRAAVAGFGRLQWLASLTPRAVPLAELTTQVPRTTEDQSCFNGR